MFVESKDKPSTDPVLIWFNGGPGCSSLLGYFMENGPFVMDDGQSVLHKNPDSWNRRANTLYIESPAGVGFSIAGTVEDLSANDMTSSQDAFVALQAWYTKFPEFKVNDLYISGESYAGIYVPYLAW
jgi:carboxypeptidase C (cathepsin A)